MEKGKDFHFLKYDSACLVYPDTFMNESGRAVENALAWFKKSANDAVVFHDDSDLALGEYKDAAGGSAGHRGVESIFAVMGETSILRVRIGVRDPLEKSGEQPRRKAGEFVLKKMRAEDLEKLRTDVFENLAARFLN
jgi:peptidyl-tRNA hydrolase